MAINERPKVIVYVTRYALTNGIMKLDGHLLERAPKPDDWHTDLQSARARVREMITAKVKSLRKSLAKMEKLAQDYKE